MNKEKEKDLSQQWDISRLIQFSSAHNILGHTNTIVAQNTQECVQNIGIATYYCVNARNILNKLTLC